MAFLVLYWKAFCTRKGFATRKTLESQLNAQINNLVCFIQKIPISGLSIKLDLFCFVLVIDPLVREVYMLAQINAITWSL